MIGNSVPNIANLILRAEKRQSAKFATARGAFVQVTLSFQSL
jgi:hypothetical protein